MDPGGAGGAGGAGGVHVWLKLPEVLPESARSARAPFYQLRCLCFLSLRNARCEKKLTYR